jgi:hypothetical protein
MWQDVRYEELQMLYFVYDWSRHSDKLVLRSEKAVASAAGAKPIRDDTWKGRSAVARTQTIAHIRKFVREDRRPTIDKITEIIARQKVFAISGGLETGCPTMCFHNTLTFQIYLFREYCAHYFPECKIHVGGIQGYSLQKL